MMLGLFAIVVWRSDPVVAAEDATGIYLLGAKGSMAGYLPPPGTYVTDYSYYYNGDATGRAAVGRALRDVGNVSLEADVGLIAQAFVEIPLLLWVAPGKVFGGNVGFGVMMPYGWKEADVALDVLASLTLPNGTTLARGRHFNIDDDEVNFGDPLLTAVMGWHEGSWHWNVGALLNVPIGEWEKDNISNIGFNRWALDITPAVTWLDPKLGFEVSVAAGFTFNWENPDTDYKTGTEFHLEWALMQHVSKTFAVGLAGYHYQQVTGDGGAGAELGGFEGRVTALGPDITYTLMCGALPISTEWKWLHEFDVENRVEGDAGMLNVTIPLAGTGH
jgi:hypothetical protein